MDLNELIHARSRANPFETLKTAFFMNRAALKIANIDALTNFMFSNIANDVSITYCLCLRYHSIRVKNESLKDNFCLSIFSKPV